MEKTFKLAMCQMKVVDDKNTNLKKAKAMIENAAKENAHIAVLPEMFICPYDKSKFSQYAETEKGFAVKELSGMAREYGIYLVGGSVPELDGDLIYNTSYIFDSKGTLIGKHRKVHLFDIDVPGGITFKESENLAPGKNLTIADIGSCSMGVAICYDMRFPELFRLMSLKGVKLIIIPAAFNMVTGPAHWELTLRARAVDNQVYTVAVSPARDLYASYVAYGNSMVVGPWGNIAVRAGADEELIICDIDLSEVDRIREQLPLLKHRRTDVYEIIEKNPHHK